MPEARSSQTFRVVLVKPSHYDDDGYVIQWLRSGIPSNSLAAVYGLVVDCATKRVLGPDVEIAVEAYDECNTTIDIKGIVRRIRAAGGGFVGLIGVQSNQFPRALDLAYQFRAAGLPVVIGGFHVSGCLSMLPELPPDLQEAQSLGVTLFAGEGEGRVAALLRDLHEGRPQPIYNHLANMPDMEGAVLPFLPRDIVHGVLTKMSSFDAGRGCPFQCSFCTIINVQGRKSRFRTADDVEAIVRANAAQGVTRFFLTDDNFARNRNWEAILDRLIDLRENRGIWVRLLIQVDTLCHRIPNFIEKCARAGCTTVFLGLENINPELLMGTKKRQNKIWEYREMLLAWRRAKVMTYAGYILGFPSDTPELITRDIEIIKRELPVDLLEFFMLTPLPGSEDHQRLHKRGAPMEPDMNRYDLEHVCAEHPKMTAAQWGKAYKDAWKQYYSIEHTETLLKRGAATGISLSRLCSSLTAFGGSVAFENVHPLQLGVLRRKVRTQRRRGLPIEHPLVFYPRRLVELCVVLHQWSWHALRIRFIRKRIEKDPAASNYMDEALRLVGHAKDDEVVQFYADKIPKTHGAPVRETEPA